MPGPLAGKRIGLLAGWASRKNGGVFEAMIGQAKMIRALGGEPMVFACRDEFSSEDSARFGCETVYSERLGPEALAYAPSLGKALRHARLDCLHLHGIWHGSSLTGARWAKHNAGRYIISLHGMLDPWITGRSRAKKALFHTLVERRNWRSASLFHALTQDEADDIHRWAPGKQIAVIANPAPALGPVRNTMPPPTVLYLGRIHEKKNIGALIEGWQLARANLPAPARLVIAGWGDAESVDVLNRTVATGDPAIRFVGAAFGAQKQALFEHARFLVLPSHSEGLPMTILEAWSAGLPSIQTPACHLPEGPATGAALPCETNTASIARVLSEALACDEERWLALSSAAQTLAGGQFSAGAVASRWASVYAQVMEAEPRHE